MPCSVARAGIASRCASKTRPRAIPADRRRPGNLLNVFVIDTIGAFRPEAAKPIAEYHAPPVEKHINIA
jgi:hypothetical protein